MRIRVPADAERKAFACRLRALRQAYGARTGYIGLTAHDFAKLLGISGARYGRYERGELNPPFNILLTIRRLTGVSLCMLMAGERNGDDTIIAPEGLSDGDYGVGDRLRMVREILEPSLLKAAIVMRVEAATWAEWENGAVVPPISKMAEFSHQFGDRYNLGLDFLYRGILDGVKKELVTELTARNPLLIPKAKGSAAGNGRRRRRRALGNKLRPETVKG